MKKQLPDADIIRELLDYDPNTGFLRWKQRPLELFSDNAYWAAEAVCKAWNTKWAGKRAFTTRNKIGYHTGLIFKNAYVAHRIIWKWVHGTDPVGEIDHINHIRGDNRLVNLQDIPLQLNRRWSIRPILSNTGVRGVYFNTEEKRWVAEIGKTRLGRFKTLEDATAARQEAEVRLNWNRH